MAGGIENSDSFGVELVSDPICLKMSSVRFAFCEELENNKRLDFVSN